MSAYTAAESIIALSKPQASPMAATAGANNAVTMESAREMTDRALARTLSEIRVW